MANKRMFSKKITDTDAFIDMPSGSQSLYFHLNMNADDDGFVSSPKKILRMVSAKEDDLKVLFLRRFVLGFDSGVLVIKHRRIHNTLRSDRYNETSFQTEKSLLKVCKNNAYTERQGVLWGQNGDILVPKGGHNGIPLGNADIDIGLDIDKEEEYILGNSLEKGTTEQSNAGVVDTRFEEFRNLYPKESRKYTKSKLIKKLKSKIKTNDQFEELIKGTHGYIQSVVDERENGFTTLKYKNILTFVNQESWKIEEYQDIKIKTPEEKVIENIFTNMDSENYEKYQLLGKFYKDNYPDNPFGEGRKEKYLAIKSIYISHHDIPKGKIIFKENDNYSKYLSELQQIGLIG